MTETTSQTFKLGRLTKRSEFLHVRRGKYQAQGGLVIQMRETQTTTLRSTAMRVGFTATKKIGNAVIRNRSKRRLREVARAVLPEFGQAGMDYVFIARDSTASRPYDKLIEDARRALTRLNAPAHSPRPKTAK